jgi:hypothetical protein
VKYSILSHGNHLQRNQAATANSVEVLSQKVHNKKITRQNKSAKKDFGKNCSKKARLFMKYTKQ